MLAKKLAAFGVFTTRPGAENAVNMLKAAGYRNTDISLLFPHAEKTVDIASKEKSEVPEDALIGAGAGAVIGGSIGWIAGIGLLAIPGLGPFIAAGPIMAALAGVGIGGAVGGISGTLISIGIPEKQAKRYEEKVKKGGIFLSVHCDNYDWTSKAEDLLRESGAKDVSSSVELTVAH